VLLPLRRRRLGGVLQQMLLRGGLQRDERRALDGDAVGVVVAAQHQGGRGIGVVGGGLQEGRRGRRTLLVLLLRSGHRGRRGGGQRGGRGEGGRGGYRAGGRRGGRRGGVGRAAVVGDVGWLLLLLLQMLLLRVLLLRMLLLLLVYVAGLLAGVAVVVVVIAAVAVVAELLLLRLLHFNATALSINFLLL